MKDKNDLKVDVDFFLSAHKSPTDFERLPELLSSVDIFVPESLGWSPQTLKYMRQLADGSVTPDSIPPHIPRDSAQYKLLESLYNTKVTVLCADVPSGHVIEREILKNTDIKGGQKLSLPVKEFLTGHFDKAIESRRKEMAEYAALVKQRERFIVQQLRRQFGAVLKDFPALKKRVAERQQKQLKAVVQLGILHTNVAHDFRKQAAGGNAYTSKIKLGKDKFIFGPRDQITRTFLAGREAKVQDELYAQSLLEEVLLLYLFKNIEDTAKKSRLLQRLSQSLPLQNLRDLSRELSHKVPGTDEKAFLRAKLRRAGVVIPNSEAEIDRLLKINN